MAKITTLRKSCPICNHILHRGPLTLGPRVIKCRKCGSSVNTGLKSWLDLSAGGKIGVVVSELLAPSFLANQDGFGRFIMNFLICCFVCMPAVIGIGSSAQEFAAHRTTQAIADLAIMPLGLWYPTLLLWRVLRLRSQSIRYKRDGQLFQW